MTFNIAVGVKYRIKYRGETFLVDIQRAEGGTVNFTLTIEPVEFHEPRHGSYTVANFTAFLSSYEVTEVTNENI